MMNTSRAIYSKSSVYRFHMFTKSLSAGGVTSACDTAGWPFTPPSLIHVENQRRHRTEPYKMEPRSVARFLWTASTITEVDSRVVKCSLNFHCDVISAGDGGNLVSFCDNLKNSTDLTGRPYGAFLTECLISTSLNWLCVSFLFYSMHHLQSVFFTVLKSVSLLVRPPCMNGV